MANKITTASAPPQPEPPVGGTALLFEYGGWAIYTTLYAREVPREGNTLTHVGCDSEFPMWTMSLYVWDGEYSEEGPCRLVCKECGEVLTKHAWEMFAKTYRLLNMP
jgi:hypothetical protein